MYKATLIPGDGIGPEVIRAATEVIEAAGVKISWEEKLIGQSAMAKYNNPLPEDTISSIEANRIALKGPSTTEIAKGFRSANISLRQRLNLYANIRPIRTIEGVNTKLVLSDSNASILVQETDSQDALYVVMPMRL